MSSHPPAPHLSSLAVRQRGVAAASAGRRLRQRPREHWLVIAGLLLAQVLVVMLYLVTVDNVEQAQRKRLQREEQARQLHHCAMLAQRVQREQCRLTLQLQQIESGSRQALLSRP